MNTFSLEIIASDKKFFSGRANAIVLPTPDGEVAVMAHHQNMLMAVVPGTARFEAADNPGVKVPVVVSSGFAEVINNRVKVLVLTAERPEDIDVLRAKEAQERAREQLRQKQSMEEYHRSKLALARAMSRIRAGSKGHEIN